MGTFVVRDTPDKLYLGEQPRVTLINEGPYTVYLDSVPSVSKDNGFPLPPTGQMTWRSDVELWAVTRQSGFTATVKSNPSGELSLTTRAKFVSQIYNKRIETSTWETPILETGHCNTLVVNRAAPGISGAAPAAAENIVLTWYNDNLEVLFVENYTPIICTTWFGNVGPGRNWKGIIPVKGKFVHIDGSGTGDTTGTIRIDGTDILLPSRMDGGVYFSGGGPSGTIAYDGRTLSLTTWTGVGDLYIPSNGTVIHCAINNTAAGAGVLRLVNVLDGSVVENFNSPVGLSTYRFDVAVNVPLRLTLASGTVTGTVLFTWPNDPITC